MKPERIVGEGPDTLTAWTQAACEAVARHGVAVEYRVLNVVAPVEAMDGIVPARVQIEVVPRDAP